MKKKLTLFCMIMLLAACGSSSKDKSVTCTFDSGDSGVVEKVDVTYDSDKKVKSLIVSQEAALADYLFEDYDVKELEELYKDKYVNPNKKQEGLTFDISVDKKAKKLFVKVEVDTSKVSESDMTDLGLNDFKEVNDLVKGLKANNYTCDKIE
ncbi:MULTISPECIES: hypothetical protein [unclassified Breznakia]|uniref:hypothetical protein n=1 Tax=unclassified Breznakia TaxID=2623764 RepID=UPI002476AAAD|nr:MULTISPECIES: hypothetical protein [unclassified Breznakia]MDH6365863.1 hypothetical protein [Breznakia sp. PH1-1]MDH6403205.1 hypothetical protein [Breznakia sp. PF1-11]MDH6410914.1 hypothetical protein [Breznakia sp. PFB1-11]MDH6413029.1 hypothetical protein [Breznakia sp. PFB1-14]MDH6415397.1 hypothetical protein [Breznakia sp. PFB1-4]